MGKGECGINIFATGLKFQADFSPPPADLPGAETFRTFRDIHK